MITCPNCGKENADESVHCGFCGHQLQEGGKKTMFGMAALDSDAIKAAAEAAKQAAQAASTDQSDPFAKTEMMPSISGEPDALGSAPSPNFGSAPSPSFPSSSPSEEPAATPAPDPFADDFAALEERFGNDPSLDVPASPEPAGSLPGLGTPPGQTPSSAPNAGFPDASNAGPVGGAQQDPGMVNNPMVQAPNTSVEKKSNKGLIIALVLGGVFLFFVCAGGGIVAVLMNQ